MDPLSITVSAITLISAVSASINLLQQIRSMPEELRALLEDLAALKMVLIKLEALMEDPECQKTIQNSALPELVSAAQASLVEIDEILTSRFLRRVALESGTKLRRMAAFRYLQRLKELQHTLLTTRINLAATLSVFIAYESYQITNWFPSSRFDLCTAGGIMRITLMTFSSRYQSTQIQHSVEDSARTIKDLEESISQAFLEHGSMLKEIHNKMDYAFTSSDTSTNVTAETKPAQVLQNQIRRVGRAYFCQANTLEVEIQSCVRSCICKCHRYTRICSPELLRKAVGTFFLEYAAFTLLGGSCDKRVCKKKSQSILRATYFFPRWLLLRMISATLWAPDLQAYKISLKTPRVVPEQSDVFEFARRGDIHGLQSLFEKGLASVHDVCAATGAPPITYAIDRNQVATWRFFLNAGADPFQLNYSNQTTIDIAWNKILANSIPESCRTAIREDFDSTDYFEHRQFPTIHLIILGLVNADLETQILLSTDPIDRTDWQGRTALSWAAAKGDLKSVEMLLKHGADANIPSLNGSTPLMFASRAPNPSCLKTLLAAGARPDDKNAWHVRALEYAMRIESGTRYMLPLLRGGADANLCHPGRSDPLACAVKAGNTRQIACLIDHGAKPREFDGGIFAMLQTCIRSRKVESVLLLCVRFCTQLGQYERRELLKMAEGAADDPVFEALHENLKAGLLSNNDIGSEGVNGTDTDVFFDALESQIKEL